MARIIKKQGKGAPPFPQAGERQARQFSDAEIIARAKADPDAPPLTSEQLAQFRRVNPAPKRK